MISGMLRWVVQSVAMKPKGNCMKIAVETVYLSGSLLTAGAVYNRSGSKVQEIEFRKDGFRLERAVWRINAGIRWQIWMEKSI